MKWLCLDIGNTRTKYSIWDFQKDCLLEHGSSALAEIHGWIKNKQISKVFYIHVTNLDEEKIIPTDWIPFQHNWKLPILNLYKTPNTLGQDRLMSVIGAALKYPNQHCLVIDAGTCLKLDIIDNQKNFVGGSISPGLRMRLQAMHAFTDKLPLYEPETFFETFGANTKESMLCGAVQGMVAEIEGRIQQFSNIYNPLRVLLSGGDAEFLAKHLKTPIFADPLLIQHGIYACAKTNF